MEDFSHVRAVRNNNPGNIDRGQNWQGLMPVSRMTPEQRAEPRFCVFEDAACGFRAMILILGSYHRRLKDFTVRSIISTWAPPGENNTQAYIDHVCALTGFSPDTPLEPNVGTLRALVKAISTHEIGEWYFNDQDLDRGLVLAGS